MVGGGEIKETTISKSQSLRELKRNRRLVPGREKERVELILKKRMGVYMS